MLSLEGKTAVITGAARGQGAEAARLFARLGARVLLGDVRDGLGREVAAGIGERAHYVHLDVTDAAQWAAAVDTACERFGRLDILVNNAGVFRSVPLHEEDPEAFEATLRVNLVGPFLGMRAVRTPMIRAGGGAIVNVSSIAGLTGIARTGGYGASKWGLRGLTKVAALELGEHGIRVNSVHPGIIDTPMVEGIAPPAGAGNHPAVALRRIGLPQDVAGLVAFLASDAAGFLTGAEIAVDGGSTAGEAPAAVRAG
ncbi:glucose 1-dehydrogenase [Streptomyces sp. Pv4-95]|uniref:SDR family NAD(P)-dependent oxidoreductase n=1 Tax=Streptomyces sp. Pv4-95 TaxID=3049543 RepID=UPI0038914E81